VPPITGTSLVPWMVTVTSLPPMQILRSAGTLSVIDWSAPSCWIADRPLCRAHQRQLAPKPVRP